MITPHTGLILVDMRVELVAGGEPRQRRAQVPPLEHDLFWPRVEWVDSTSTSYDTIYACPSPAQHRHETLQQPPQKHTWYGSAGPCGSSCPGSGSAGATRASSIMRSHPGVMSTAQLRASLCIVVVVGGLDWRWLLVKDVVGGGHAGHQHPPTTPHANTKICQ